MTMLSLSSRDGRGASSNELPFRCVAGGVGIKPLTVARENDAAGQQRHYHHVGRASRATLRRHGGQIRATNAGRAGRRRTGGKVWARMGRRKESWRGKRPDQDRGTGLGDAADRFGLTSLPPHATEWQERRETDDGITFAPHVQISPPSLLLRYLMGYIQILLSVSPQIAANPPTAIDFFLFTIPLARTPPISSL